MSLGYKNRNPIELDGRFTPCGVSIDRAQPADEARGDGAGPLMQLNPITAQACKGCRRCRPGWKSADLDCASFAVALAGNTGAHGWVPGAFVLASSGGGSSYCQRTCSSLL
jgi:hypothetical protein